ncbi:phenylalanine--tRNA ligase subunit beta [Wenzhouxiangella sp. AB-CW3]|uniref:phenylalanine--tRNA ligase subunit beta n=1 Tax=Wenzhouxiangella sp. AB-CW3 TaxID=2771012 RepID=UPI00168A61CB|nr:phenylalanine--tRNA ligase subunit beta [Wenzhouxiangella sp. AB-CW3]QOC23959.1 phenylalanine--tRNA ligase subunit beta [Wenzhouxiangella sp. AB-CW3]
MKISYRWLTEWVDTDLAAEEVAERFTLAGLEVDSVEPAAASLDGVVVGEIAAVEAHPDADRLSVCRVRGDTEERTIVCGAPNARVGLKAPLATLGTTLPGGMKIKPAKLRGVASSGMLCSEPELGLGEEAGGLMELPADAPVGTALSEFLELDDVVFEIDLTPNRADCLSVRGLARELAAIADCPLNEPEIPEVSPETQSRIAIDLQAPADCPCYVGRVIEGIDPTAETPLWIREKLRRAGIRSLGPVVDVTNFVLLELGQPMHAFDLDQVSGGIRVRRARSGDQITLLDGQEVSPDEDMLLIADHDDRPLAIGGIMGGLDSAVSDTTRDILLESAWFNPAVISGRARRMGLSTESAHRFERGVDPALQRRAIERATSLILDIAGGSPGPVVEECVEERVPVNTAVRLRLERVNRLLGTELRADEVGSILGRLGMAVRQEGEEFHVQASSARRDIEIEADLIEEVARIYGYDQLPVRRPGGRLTLRMSPESRLPERQMREQLAARGFQQIMSWSFVSLDALDALGMAAGAQPLANPLSRDMGVLRTSLLPGMLDVAGRNMRRQHHHFRLFECGACFRVENDTFVERERLGLLMLGAQRGEHFSGRGREVDFYDLKGEIEHLLERNSVAATIEFRPVSLPWLHPGQAAEVLLNGQSAGWMGQLHPALLDDLELGQPPFVAELDLLAISQRELPLHQDTGRFPAVRRDLALVVPDRHSAAEVLAIIKKEADKWLEKAVIFDQYRGEGIESGSRSLAIGLIFRDVSRTLEDREIDSVISRVVARLEEHLAAKLRG